jgi:hypothetical protein
MQLNMSGWTHAVSTNEAAELSETINSMYQWYARSVACYVYLNDVPSWPEGCYDLYEAASENFPRRKWFTRGWTLQELVAPSKVYFVDQEWTTVLGDATTFGSLLCNITGIQLLWTKPE